MLLKVEELEHGKPFQPDRIEKVEEFGESESLAVMVRIGLQ